jgi:sterol desaturase/sphingolipid hydroxylase (fatty acid hydroxylase superfamily)
MTTVAGTGLVFLLAGIPAMHTGSTNLTEQMVMAALIFICSDFFLYWSHRIFHLFNPLWRLHVLHHRPPVLTPITAFRFWPPEAAVHFIAFNLGAGIAIGIASTIFGIGVAPATYAGLNVFLLVWYLAFSHLRHSHVPLYFPRPFSFLFVSPHMHQAHHSIEVQHHHRNFGTALAIWDWMFGTLFIPAGNERFQFGVIDAEPAKWREKSA